MLRARVVPPTLARVQPPISAILAIETSSQFALVSTPACKECCRIQNVIRQTGTEPATWDTQARIRKENFKKNPKKIGRDDMDWMNRIQDTAQLWAHVNAVKNLL